MECPSHYTRKYYFCTVYTRGIMKEFTVEFGSVQDVQRFVELATQQPYPITLGNEFHRVNGKSFMEIFSLNFDYPLTAWLDCSDEQYSRFVAAVNN